MEGAVEKLQDHSVPDAPGDDIPPNTGVPDASAVASTTEPVPDTPKNPEGPSILEVPVENQRESAIPGCIDVPVVGLQYLGRLRNSPYQTDVLTERVLDLEEICSVTCISVSKDARAPFKPSQKINKIHELVSHVCAGAESHSKSCSFAVRDPPPTVVGVLGELLNIPLEFFAAHAASGGIIRRHDMVSKALATEEREIMQLQQTMNLTEGTFLAGPR